MKTKLLAACALTIAGSVLGQGTVIFSSYNSLGTTHFWGPSPSAPWLSFVGNNPLLPGDSPGGTNAYLATGMSMIGSTGTGGKYGSSTTLAQLLYANGANQPESSLVPGGQTTTFRTGNTVGRISLIIDTITGLVPDSAAATFEMVAWDNSTGQYPTWTEASVAWWAGAIAAGKSGAFTLLDIGGSINTPPPTLPSSFNLYFIPEPSPFALAGLGAAVLMAFRHRKDSSPSHGRGRLSHMGTLILAAFALAGAGSVLAQGTVVFSCYNSLGTTHFWAPSDPNAKWALSLTGNGPNDSPPGTVNYAGSGLSMIGSLGIGGKYGSSTTFAQLLWANGPSQPASSLVPGGQTTTFRTGNTVGRITMITDTITGLTPDSAAATFAMVAWDNSSGNYGTWAEASVAWMAGLIFCGESSPFTLDAIGGSFNTPPVMLPPSFNIYLIPEPSTFALAGLGAAVLMVFRHRKCSSPRQGQRLHHRRVSYMKTLILAAFALSTARGALAQGTVVFSSYNSLGTVHFWGPSPSAPWLSLIGDARSPVDPPNLYAAAGMSMIGSTGTGGKYGSSTTLAQLLWANGANQPESSLVPGGQTTTFRSGNTVGRISLIIDTITGLVPDSAAATFDMVAWDNSTGQYPTWTEASVAWRAGAIAAGESGAFTLLAIGGSSNTPPLTLPSSFNLHFFIPEPSPFALAGLGAAVLMAFRHRKDSSPSHGRGRLSRMGALILGAFALAAGASVFAQGTVIFGCYNSLGTTHFWGPSATVPGLSLTGNSAADTPAGTTDYAGHQMAMLGTPGSACGAATTFAQLLWANGANQPENSLVPGGQTTTFRTGNTVGRISVITDTISGLTPDSAAATFEMVAWDNSSGKYPTWTDSSAAILWSAPVLYGMSAPFTVYNIGGSFNAPPLMLPPSFNLFIIPEPSTFALAGLGAAVLMVFRHRKCSSPRQGQRLHHRRVSYMKTLMLAAFALSTARGVLAQGTVIFSCYGSLGTTHFWGPSPSAPWLSFFGNDPLLPGDLPGDTNAYLATGMSMIGTTGTGGKYGSSTTLAQLLYANGANQPESSLVPGGQTTTFRTGNTLGRISLITDTITGLVPDSAAATFEMVAWDNSTGQYPTWTEASMAWWTGAIAAGKSGAFTLYGIGGTASPGPDTLPQSFNLYFIPEPSTFALAGLGAAVLMAFRYRR